MKEMKGITDEKIITDKKQNLSPLGIRMDLL
jgi:hypothetical protein